jgi:prophage tail gpP-like protein
MASDLPQNRVILTVNGKAFDGFERGSVTLTMEDYYNSFQFEYVADGKKPSDRSIWRGDKCSIAIDAGGGAQELIKDGYITGTSDEDEPTAIVLGCRGYSNTYDLKGSSITRPGSWKGVGLKKIAETLAKPFGIKVKVEGDSGGNFANFSASKGESTYETIRHAAELSGMYLFTVGDTLMIARAGSKASGATLERGKNIVRSRREDNDEDRYSEYVYRGQIRGTDEAAGKKASQNKASVKDAGFSRYCPLLLQDSGTATQLQRKAEVERNRRAGRGEVITLTVDGWGHNGKPWQPNTTVEVNNPVIGVQATLLVVTATYNFGPDSPCETELRCMRKEAFDVAEFPKSKRGKKYS